MKKLRLKGIVPYLHLAQTGMLFIITLTTLTFMNNKKVIGCRVTTPDRIVCIQK